MSADFDHGVAGTKHLLKESHRRLLATRTVKPVAFVPVGVEQEASPRVMVANVHVAGVGSLENRQSHPSHPALGTALFKTPRIVLAEAIGVAT